MYHKQSDEDQLEKLLRQMPKVKDDRDPQQIYRAIQPELAKKQRRKMAMPAMVVAAALLLLAVIAPIFLQNMQYNHNSMDHSGNKEMARSGFDAESSDDSDDSTMNLQIEETQDSAGEQEAAGEESTTSDFTAFDAKMEPSNVVYHVNEEEEYVVTIGVTANSVHAMSTINAFTFPISIVIPKAGEKSYFAALERIRYEIPYTQLELETPSLNQGALITYDSELPGNPTTFIEVGNLYESYSLMQQETLENEIAETFRWTPYTFIQFTSNGSPDGAVIGNVVKKEPYGLTVFGKKAYYKFHPTKQSPTFIVPSQVSFDTIEEALKAMEERPEQDKNSKIEASIPTTIQVENVQTGGEGSSIVRIVLSPTSLLENTDETIFALEAMMMTAKEFGFQQVIFESAKNGMIGNIELNQPVDVPHSPNPVAYPY